MTYVLEDGTILVLAVHTPAQWAPIVEAQMRAIGCSAAYARRRRKLIEGAVPRTSA